MNNETKENLIRLAMKEAEKAIKKGNPPFGAVLTEKKGDVIATAFNTQNSSRDPTAHAEINLLRKASKILKTPYFGEYCIFGNAQLCSMCMSACIKAGITFFYYGAPSEKSMDPDLSVFDVAKKSKHTLHIEIDILKDECIKQISRGRNKLQKII